MAVMGFDYEKSFWSKVDKTAGCWYWSASTRTGYGQFWYGATKWSSHRLAYTLVRGPIEDGMVLDHICRVRHCVNPAHLEVVDVRENTVRGDRVVNKRSSLPVGVRLANGHKKFQARKKFNGKNCYLGGYTTAEEASIVYQTAIIAS